VQLPADHFLSFMENILRQDQNGQEPIVLIMKVIDDIHNQYQSYLTTNNTTKVKLTVKEIVEQLTREFSL
jgi:hypothetical protein